MITLDNFDWSITNRELVIFIPNWGRGKYIRKTIATIKTSIPQDKWIVLVINDRIHEDFSDLKNQNVVYLTFGSDASKEERGDAFMRNIAIKRCCSRLFFQKDPEIIITGDFIAHALNCPTDLYRLGGPAIKVPQDISEQFLQDDATIQDCESKGKPYPIHQHIFVCFHYGFCVPTKILKNMHGYDEDYKLPYCADHDLYDRLMAQGIHPTMDNECHPLHLWHQYPGFQNKSQAKPNYDKMKAIFASKNPKNWLRNPKGWGNGDIH